MARSSLLLATCVALSVVAGAARTEEPTSLADLSLEALMDIEVTSVSKRSQLLSETASAAYVLTSEDIAQSNATNIVDLLRLVPGVNVAVIDSNKFAVSIRGFTGLSATKLLVLVDGRSIYSPLFSGTFWNFHDFVLDDIDRIEVIRGPGATVWGANAVNGVINIITKDARATLGTLATATVGTTDRFIGEVRQGVGIGDESALRVFAKGRLIGDGGDRDGVPANDGWQDARAGFRFDGALSPLSTLTVDGEIIVQRLSSSQNLPSLTAPFATTRDAAGDTLAGHLLLNYVRQLEDNQELQLKAFYDFSAFENLFLPDLEQSSSTFDVEINRTFSIGANHKLIAGVGYRRNFVDTNGNPDNHVVITDNSPYQIFSAFIQDDISLLDEQLIITIGSKFEHNEFSGFELQPTVRALGKLSEDQVLWGSVSRAVRTPSPAETAVSGLTDVLAPAPPSPLPTELRLAPNPNFRSEKLIAVEAGYRHRILSTLAVDLAAYANFYDDLAGSDPEISIVGGPPARIRADITRRNTLSARTLGFEAAADATLSAGLNTRVGYAFHTVDVNGMQNGSEAIAPAIESGTPKHSGFIKASYELGADLRLNGTVRFASEILEGAVDGYVDADLGAAWSPLAGLQLELVGRNLLGAPRPEFVSETRSFNETEVERAVFLRLKATF